MSISWAAKKQLTYLLLALAVIVGLIFAKMAEVERPHLL